MRDELRALRAEVERLRAEVEQQKSNSCAFRWRGLKRSQRSVTGAREDWTRAKRSRRDGDELRQPRPLQPALPL